MSAERQEAGDEAKALEREGWYWVVRAMANNASPEVRAEAERWRRQSPAHEEAYAKAVHLRQLVAAQEDFRDAQPNFLEKSSTRRAALIFAAGGAASYFVLKPPLQLWPSLAQLTADYRSPLGERRTVDVAQGVSVELNTDTSLSRHDEGVQTGARLISGEIAVTARRPPSQPYVVFADDGRVMLHQATCDVRKTENGIQVLCLNGQIEVRAAGSRAILEARQQVRYDSSGLGKSILVDPVLVTAWRQGWLVFRDTPFGAIVEEVNRYRSGRIVIVNSNLASRRYNAVFDLNKVDGLVDHLRRLSHSSATTLGNITLLS